MNNEQNVSFLQIVLLTFNILIPVSFPLVKASLKLLFGHSVKLQLDISFNFFKSNF